MKIYFLLLVTFCSATYQSISSRPKPQQNAHRYHVLEAPGYRNTDQSDKIITFEFEKNIIISSTEKTSKQKKAEIESLEKDTLRDIPNNSIRARRDISNKAKAAILSLKSIAHTQPSTRLLLFN